MSDLGRARPVTLLDMAWQIGLRLAFPLARFWWQVRRQHHEGALVALYVGQALLLVRSSYRIAWNFPGGGIRRGEIPEAAAKRELAEEIGLTIGSLLPAGSACGVWEGRRERVYFFELHLDRLPPLQVDNREIVASRVVPLNDLRGMALTGPVIAYLQRRTVNCSCG
jgi:8-oxo-dGTP diphosphatase